MKTLSKPETVEEYVQDFPADVQKILQKIRKTIKHAAPAATEVISYGIPTYKLTENLVHFGAFKNHIGFYPTPSGMVGLDKQLAPFKKAKGSIQFPLSEPFPYDLITKIVEVRIKQIKEKAA